MSAALTLTEAQTAEIAEKVASLTDYAEGLLQEKKALENQVVEFRQRVKTLEGEKIRLEKVASTVGNAQALARDMVTKLQQARIITKAAATNVLTQINEQNAPQHLHAMGKVLLEKSAMISGPGDLVYREPAAPQGVRPADPHGDFAFLYK